MIPCSFDTFKSILIHYYEVVLPLESSGCANKWRNHLNKGEKKRFQRFKRVIDAFRKKLLDDTISSNNEIKKQFEDSFQTNRKSLAALADVYAKNILK